MKFLTHTVQNRPLRPSTEYLVRKGKIFSEDIEKSPKSIIDVMSEAVPKLESDKFEKIPKVLPEQQIRPSEEGKMTSVSREEYQAGHPYEPTGTRTGYDVTFTGKKPKNEYRQKVEQVTAKLEEEKKQGLVLQIPQTKSTIITPSTYGQGIYSQKHKERELRGQPIPGTGKVGFEVSKVPGESGIFLEKEGKRERVDPNSLVGLHAQLAERVGGGAAKVRVPLGAAMEPTRPMQRREEGNILEPLDTSLTTAATVAATRIHPVAALAVPLGRFAIAKMTGASPREAWKEAVRPYADLPYEFGVTSKRWGEKESPPPPTTTTIKPPEPSKGTGGSRKPPGQETAGPVEQKPPTQPIPKANRKKAQKEIDEAIEAFGGGTSKSWSDIIDVNKSVSEFITKVMMSGTNQK